MGSLTTNTTAHHCYYYSSCCCKSQHRIFRNLWQQTPTSTRDASLLRRGRTHFSILLLPRILLLHPHSLPFRHPILLPRPPFCPLFRPRTPPLPTPMSSLASTPPPQPQFSTKTERVVVKGRVQGVFYRNWTVENAKDLGLKGWVRNRKNGSVEALFSGPPEKVQEMQQRCRRGPPAAIVTGLEAFPSDDDPGTAFEQRQTI